MRGVPRRGMTVALAVALLAVPGTAGAGVAVPPAAAGWSIQPVPQPGRGQ